MDVGNSEIAAGLFREGGLEAEWRLASDRRRTPDEYAMLLRHLLRTGGFDPAGVESLTLASVVPPLTEIIEDTARRLGVEPETIGADSDLPVRLEVDEPLTVGADRVANTLAASRMYRADTVVVDLGTATTYDCVTHDGAFTGGVIAPGVRTASERLTEAAAKLPKVGIGVPGRVIGQRTEECIQSGVFYAAVDSIDGMVLRILEEWERPGAVVVATGGLAGMIAPHCQRVALVEPHLTLYGVEFARQYLASRGG